MNGIVRARLSILAPRSQPARSRPRCEVLPGSQLMPPDRAWLRLVDGLPTWSIPVTSFSLPSKG